MVDPAPAQAADSVKPDLAMVYQALVDDKPEVDARDVARGRTGGSR
jgi:hypothetical protein